jgi:hypothetical protein
MMPASWVSIMVVGREVRGYSFLCNTFIKVTAAQNWADVRTGTADGVWCEN